MMGGRATRAIAQRTVLGMPGVAELAAALSAVYGAFFAPSDVAVLFGVAGVVAAALATVAPRRVAEVRNLRYFTAPLYGRELARALAIPRAFDVAAYALIAALFAAAVSAGGAQQQSWTRLGVFVIAQEVATSVALSACLRAGLERSLYVSLGIIAGIAIDAIAAAAAPLALVVALFFGLIIGFFALRAFGETLARYDPIEDA